MRAISSWGIGVLLLFAGTGIAAPAASADVALNEINCDGTDWIELANTSPDPADVSGWVLADDPLGAPGDPMTFPNPTVIPGNDYLAVTKGSSGFAFGISCSSDTIRLGDPSLNLVDEESLPGIDFDLDSWGRSPDGTGDWRQTFPTKGTANQPSPSGVDEAAEIFDPTEVADIDLGLPQSSMDALAVDPDTYVPGSITLTTSTTTYERPNVGIRLKGNATFRTLDDKAAFKVKIPFSVPGQRLAGLRTLTLNNMVEDPSMVHELLAYRAYRALGLPASRTGYAQVSVNGIDYGLHLNLETLDDVFFAGQSTQHLYEGELGDDTETGAAGDFEIDEGTENNTSDLDALIAAVQGDTPADFSDRVAGFADLQEMVRMWAVERYIGHWDGYTGLDASFSPNNYYLHSDDAGLFTMIPSGPDQAWQQHLDFGFAPGGGVMFDRCLADPSCESLYRQAVRDTRDTIAGLHVDDLAVSTASLLKPFETSELEEYTPDQIASEVASTVDFIQGRPADAAAWLGEGPTDPEIPHGVESATSSSPAASAHKKRKCRRSKKSAAKSGKCRKRKSRD
jgi:spore coat protein CotH